METGQDRELAFVKQNGPVLAAIAWGQYQELGRGALLIPSNVIASAGEGVSRIVYAPLGRLEQVHAEKQMSQSELNPIREYDPSCDCVVMFLRSEEEPCRIMTFGFKDPGALATIYEQYKERLSKGKGN
jgi:hypothetical protein